MSAALALPLAHRRPADEFRDRTPVGTRPGPHPRRRADEVHFRIVYSLTFPVFMLTSLARRLRPGARPDRAGAARPSVLREARAAAQTCGSLSLMG